MSHLSIVLVTLALAASPALGQLTVVTDELSYAPGDVVTITIRNGGPSPAQFLSVPLYMIRHVESGAIIYGQVGMPVATVFPAGHVETFSRDTGVVPDVPGTYLISLNGSSGDPGSLLQATYAIDLVVPTEAATWGAIKAVFRPAI